MTLIEIQQKIHLTTTPPVVCSSCGGQYPHRRHVDFGAAWDGPMISLGSEEQGIIGHSVDDLIVCEDCLKDAAELVGFGDVTALEESRRALVEHQNNVGQRLAKALEYVERLEKALASRESLEEVLRPKRGPGRPRKE